MASPKKMAPPVAADPGLCVVTNDGEFTWGEDVGVEVEGARGSVSNDRALRHEARTREKESARMGSCVDV